MTARVVVVVGIGADGWDGLAPASRAALASARVIYGSARQLESLPASAARLIAWRSPLAPHLDEALAADGPIHVLASGDPMFFGIGTTIVARLGAERVRVLPHVSSAALACARLGWARESVVVRSVVARPLAAVLPELSAGVRLLLLSESERSPAEIAAAVTAAGYGDSALTVLSRLGAADERAVTITAAAPAPGWDADVDALNIVALECRGPVGGRAPGLPDDVYGGDGQLTKSHVRALSVAALRPAPGLTLWDVGAGSGSIAIEWLRAEPTASAVAFETSEARRGTIASNATMLGVPRLIVRGAAPDAYGEAPDPDAVFVGGGLTLPGVLAGALDRLRSGGVVVANAVTLEGEAVLRDTQRRLGGTLTRLSVEKAGALGGFTAWRPALPVVQWVGVKS